MPHLLRWSPAFGETHDRNASVGMVVEASGVRQKASMTQSTSPLLVADSLSIARGDALLIEDLTFAVRPGEALHVQGEIGAGKSTLMLALAGLIPLAAGDIVLDRDGLAFLGHDRPNLHNVLAAIAFNPGYNIRANDILFAGATFFCLMLRNRQCHVLCHRFYKFRLHRNYCSGEH